MGTHALVSTQRAPHIPQNKTHTHCQTAEESRPYTIPGKPPGSSQYSRRGGTEYKLGLSAAHREEGEVPNTLPVLKPATIPTLT